MRGRNFDNTCSMYIKELIVLSLILFLKLEILCFYQGVVPSRCPFGLHSIVMRHYFPGAFYIRGGPSELPFHMVQVIEESGGKVLVNAPVSKIVMSSGRAVGRYRQPSKPVYVYSII